SMSDPEEWSEKRVDIFCPCGEICEQYVPTIHTNKQKEFEWNQIIENWEGEEDFFRAKPECNQGTGYFRFKISYWRKNFAEKDTIIYSDIFYINEIGSEDQALEYTDDEWIECVEDNDCEAKFYNCDCKYYCVSVDSIGDSGLEDCQKDCKMIMPNPPECACDDENKCVEKEENIIETINRRNKQDLLEMEDLDFEVENKCNNLSSIESCEKIGWPLECGCKSAHKHGCYSCFAQLEKNVDHCDKIEEDFWKTNCYWGVVVQLQKAGMKDEIDFCDRMPGEVRSDNQKGACFETAN
ncbi:hypothetical protein ACFL23_03640, partial [Patescibacteria group bacterium]